MIKHFEVKTGKNKGFYIVTKGDTSNAKDKTEYDILADIWGILPYEYNSTFYVYHKVSPQDLVWTHSGYVAHIWAERLYKKLLKQLGCSYTL